MQRAIVWVVLASSAALWACGTEARCPEGASRSEGVAQCAPDPSQLPVEQASHEIDLRVVVQADGSLLLGSTPHDERSLAGTVERRAVAAANPLSASVVGSAGVSEEQVARIRDLLREHGVEEVRVEMVEPTSAALQPSSRRTVTPGASEAASGSEGSEPPG